MRRPKAHEPVWIRRAETVLRWMELVIAVEALRLDVDRARVKAAGDG